jgi:hypothetical protein
MLVGCCGRKKDEIWSNRARAALHYFLTRLMHATSIVMRNELYICAERQASP